MRTTNNRWDAERAAAWLRRHGWADSGEQAAPPLAQQAPEAVPEPGVLDDDEIDIAGWPALVAPFYD